MEGDLTGDVSLVSKTSGTFKGLGFETSAFRQALEGCQRGLLASLGKRMGVTATEVRILYLPPNEERLQKDAERK